MKKQSILTGIFLFMLFCVHAQSHVCHSPDGKIRLSLGLNAQGQPEYSVWYKGKPVVETSRLGLKIKEHFSARPDFGLSWTQFAIDSSRVDETWDPVWGEVKTIRNNYKSLILTIRDKAERSSLMKLEFRVFNDGLGFRYELPDQPNLKSFVLVDELSTFNLTGDHKIWWMPGDFDTNEYTYNTSRISEIEKNTKKRDGNIFTSTPIQGAFVQTPLMAKSDNGVYINIHEAALVDYPAMDLQFDTKTFEAKATLAHDASIPEETDPAKKNKAYLRTNARSPWRTLVISDDAREILSSKLILNLNEPSKIKNTSFIKPMKYCGIWLEMHLGLSTWDYAGTQAASDAGADGKTEKRTKHGATTANTKRYIDFAAKNGLGGVLVEGWNTGWEEWFGLWKEDVFDFVTPYPDYDVVEVNRYARSKGVNMITHHETSGSVTNYDHWMDTAYKSMNRWGSPALKSGYVGRIIPRGEYHDGFWMINHYMRAIRKAAEKNIMVVAHEPVRPTGLHRTWPNFMAAEAARGQEFNFWSEGNPPEHETILPFTRIMGGPMDYTPGIFKIKKNYYYPDAKEQVHTTLAKQLALYVTLYSPVQMVTDLPENYEAKPDAFQFIKDVAVDWDDTRILLAEPGDYIATARKAKGTNNWFLGAISDENERTLELNFDFLDKGKTYEATLYKDAADASWDNNPEAYVIEKKTISSKTRMPVKLARGGGLAVSIMAK